MTTLITHLNRKLITIIAFYDTHISKEKEQYMDNLIEMTFKTPNQIIIVRFKHDNIVCSIEHFLVL